MRQPRQHLAFALEAQGAGEADERGMEQLDRDRALEAAIRAARAPDGATAALADRRLEHVRTDALAGERGRGGAVGCRRQRHRAGQELRSLDPFGIDDQ